MGEASPSDRSVTLSDKAFDFLLKEYDVLKDLYSESELAVQGLFNFYLTIFSAIVGALILILRSTTPSNIGIVGGLLVFAVVIGIFYQSGIVNKYADQTRYAKAISEIRIYLVTHLPETAPPLYDLPFKTPIRPLLSKSSIEFWEEKMWWLFPVGTHQLFIAFINSVCLTALLWVALVYTQLDASLVLQGTIASILIFGLSIIANDSYAKIKIRREIARHSSKIALPT